MKTYIFETPVKIGDPFNPITITQMQLASIAINFENHYAGQGKAILSIVLEDLVSGYKQNIVYESPDAMQFWLAQEASLEQAVFDKLIADQKLPQGTLSNSQVIG
jgi:argininosuccinate synthase